MYHVFDNSGVEVFKAETFARAKGWAEEARNIKLNGHTVFIVEKRERVWTTMTLDEAIRGTSYDPELRSGDRRQPR